MSDPAPPTALPQRSAALPRALAIAGLVAMLVLAGIALAGITFESGDWTYRFFLAEAIVGAVTTGAAAWWAAWSSRRGSAITVLVASILINPIWLFLLIRAFG